MKPTRPVLPCLLLVEDDPRLREVVEYAARRTGRFDTVHAVPNGAAALDWLATREPHSLPSAILTDLSMPEVDGLELMARIRADPGLRDIPTVMFSSSNRPNDEADALAAGCRAFFTKPLSLASLAEIVDTVAELAGAVQA